MTGSCLANANLNAADLRRASLNNCDLRGATLCHADLRGAFLVNADLTSADISSAAVYGISAWDVCLHSAEQRDLVITRDDQPGITVDNLEIAQFLHLILENSKIRNAIDSITTKVALILGRFTPERKRVLELVRAGCRRHGFVPILFDFEQPRTRNLTETVTILARLARFVVVDITAPRSVPHELHAAIPHLASVPVQPILLKGQRTYGMFEDLKSYPWVLPVFRYEDTTHITRDFGARILSPVRKYVRDSARTTAFRRTRTTVRSRRSLPA